MLITSQSSRKQKKNKQGNKNHYLDQKIEVLYL